MLLPNRQMAKLPGLRSIIKFDHAKSIIDDLAAFCQDAIEDHQVRS